MHSAGRPFACTLALCAVFALVLPRAATAQQAPVIASVSLTPSLATVGDRLELTIAVDHDAAFTVEGPAFGDDFGPFELVEIEEPRRQGERGPSRTTLGYTLAGFVLGSLELPPLSVRWRGGAAEGTLTTEPQSAIIQSVLVDGDDELRPLKPQLAIAEEAPSPLLPALYVAIFAALTAFGYALVARAVRERPEPVPAAAPVPPLTPAERARAALDALKLSPADIGGYYATLAAVVRRYLTERYGFAAYAMTRTELQRHMTRADFGRWPARLVANLLEECDAVQFAGFSPAPERADADLTAAYEIIELTEPPGAASSEAERA
jgi:hypothetical protein